MISETLAYGCMVVLGLILAKDKFSSWKKSKSWGEAQGLRVLT